MKRKTKKQGPARLRFRPVSGGLLADFFGSGWPAWVRALRGKSGVYVVKDRASGGVLYVGESHSGRLYDTLTRHFQSWSGPTAGATYSRGAVLVAVKVTSAGAAVAEQDRLICKLAPRDNDLSPGCEIKRNDDPF